MSGGAGYEVDLDDRFEEPWPEWQTPPQPGQDLTHAQPAPAAFVDDSARRRENLRAGIAQASALLPFLGPGIAFTMSEPGSFPRREAAKAFNGQALLALLALAASPLAWVISDGLLMVLAVIFGAGVLQALIAVITALAGRDWTSPFSRVVHLRILPEGEADPTRGDGRGSRQG